MKVDNVTWVLACRVCVLLLVLALGGCSFIAGVKTRPDASGRRSCTAAPPVIDTGVTLAAMALVAATAGGEQVHEDGNTKHVAFLFVGLPSLLVGVTTAISAVHGFSKRAACEETQLHEREAVALHDVAQARFLQATRLARAGACTMAANVGEPLADLDRVVFDHLRRDRSYARCRDHLCAIDVRAAWCIGEPLSGGQ